MARRKSSDTKTDLVESGRAPKRRKGRVRWGRIIITTLLCFLLIGLIGLTLVAGYIFRLADSLPEITAADLTMEQTSFVYDANGKELGQLHAGQNRMTMELYEFPSFLVDAVIATEDIRFYNHNGVDMRSVARAVVQVAKDSLSSGSLNYSQGASTITMQLVRNVVADTEKSMDRKIKEALLALQFEKIYDKDEILYLYMNEIYLGINVYGFAAAAEYYFGKEVADISIEEGALLVGLLRNPTYYSPYQNPERALTVRNTVLLNMINYDDSYETQARSAMNRPIILADSSSSTGADYDHPWFVDYVLTEASAILTSLEIPAEYLFSGGYHIYTTMRPQVQIAMEEAFANEDNFARSTRSGVVDPVQGGMAVMDPMTGEIVGLVGGREYTTRRGFSRATNLVRQPGSSIKPIVAYAPAIDYLGWGAGTVIDDAPMSGGYSPNNSDRAFRGRITMRAAISGSRNVCAVKALQATGTSVGWSYAVRMGLPLDESDAYNSAMALGGIATGVSPLDMAGAFATFANNGVYTEPYCITRIVDSRGQTLYSVEPVTEQVLSPQTAYLITDMLVSAVNGGTGTSARISGRTVAGKTGTVELPSASEDPDYAGRSGSKDIWFVGYTPELVGAVWIGYDNKWDEEGNLCYLPNVYGGGDPASLFSTVIGAALEGEPAGSFATPDKLASIAIDTKSGMLVSELTPAEYRGSELFRADSIPTEVSDIWEVVDICQDSNHLATQYCPNTTTTVRMRVPEGTTISTNVADYALYSPTTTCTWHTTVQSDMQAVYICTDPRHGTTRVLANIGADGSGCPSEYVALRYYGAGSMPTSYCNIEEHAVTAGGQVTTPDTGLPGATEGTDQPGGNSGDYSSSTPPGGTDNNNNSGSAVTELQTPHSLSVSPSPYGCVLSWSANNPSGTIYIIEKIEDNDSSTTVRMRTTGTSYNDEDVENGHSYSYTIYAYDPNTELISDWSQTISFSI